MAVDVSHDSSPVTVTAVRGALVVTGVPDLSALAGARAGTIGVTLSTGKQKE
jgi:hypothetical protein